MIFRRGTRRMMLPPLPRALVFGLVFVLIAGVPTSASATGRKQLLKPEERLSAQALPAANEWTQDGHDAQRTGFTPDEPLEPWTLAWTWNGSDASGGTGNHFYNAP